MSIEIRNITKVYPGGARALDGITLTLNPGTSGLLGPNGAGKTTLMRILATLVNPTTGSVSVNGSPIADRRAVRSQLGYLPQHFGFYPQLTVDETLAYMATLKGVHAPRAERLELLAQTGLADRADNRIRELSGGMVQRLGIATALLGQPPVLIVDEPTAGLDPEARVSFRSLLAGLAGERTVILSTHIVADVETTCGRIAVLERGRLVFHGTPEDLTAEAEGHVWDLEAPLDGWPQLERLGTPVAVIRRGHRIRARLLLDAPPPGFDANPAAPRLEDGYLYLLRGVQR